MILYATPLSSYAAKVRIALAAKGIAHEMRPPPGGYGAPEYRKIAPLGKVPAIDHDGYVLAESDVIIEYLDEVFPRPPLLAGDARQRGRIRFLARFHDFYLEPSLRALFSQLDPARRDAALVRTRCDEIALNLDRLEGMVEPGPYLVGDTLSLADCAYPATLLLVDMILPALDGRPSYGPKLTAWRQTLARDAAVTTVAGPYEAVARGWLDSALGR